MKTNTVAVITFYWITLVLSICILLLNAGLLFFVYGILVLPIIWFHFYIGNRIHKIPSKNPLLIYSAINFLLFSLVRIEGMLDIETTGLSALLSIFKINFGYDSNYKDFYVFGTLFFFLLQIILEIKLFTTIRAVKKAKQK